MTEEEIEANALADPDNPPLTDEELALMRFGWGRKRIRERLKPTQEQFAERFEIPLGTLLRVIEQDPEGVAKALERSYLPKPRPAR